MKPYYLYHIPQRKEWGCTTNLKRRLRHLKYKIEDVDRVITCGNVDMAADMERDLNIEYGYGWNPSQDYRVIIKAAKAALLVDYKRHNHMFTKEECSLGGYLVGKYPTEKCITARKNNISKLNLYKICPYCNIKTRGAAYNRYHGDKCKKKIII